MRRPFWQFIFETNLHDVLQDERLKGLVLNDLLNNTRRLFLKKEETKAQQQEEDPDKVLTELDNI